MLSQAEKAELQEIVAQQSQIIELLREETTLLRKDLAFVGGHINITVTPVNDALESFPSLLESPEEPQPGPLQQETGSGFPPLGVSLENEVHPITTTFNPGKSTRGGCTLSGVDQHCCDCCASPQVSPLVIG